MKEEARLSMLNELMEPRILRGQMLQRVFYARMLYGIIMTPSLREDLELAKSFVQLTGA